MALSKILKEDYNDKGVMGLPDTPGLSTSEMQRKFEEISTDVIIPKFNNLIDGITDKTGASEIGTKNGGTVQSDLDSVSSKVGDVPTLKTDVAKAKTDIEALQTEDLLIKADVEVLKSDNTTNKADITALKTDNVSSKARITTLEGDNTVNKAEINALKSDTATLNALKHTHTNKTVIDALSKDADGDLNFEGKKIKGGGGSANAYGHIKVGNKTLDAVGDDTFELVAGSNVTMTVDGKKITVNSGGGGGGQEGGDMYKSEFVLEGGTGQVLSAKEADHATSADTATNATNAINADNAISAVTAVNATKADQVGSAITSVLEGLKDVGGKLNYGDKPVSEDVVVDDVTIKNVNGTIKVADELTTKLANIAIQINGVISGDTVTFTNSKYIGGTEDYLLDPYISDTDRFLVSQTINGNTLTVVCDDVIKSGSVAVCLAFKKGV